MHHVVVTALQPPFALTSVGYVHAGHFLVTSEATRLLLVVDKDLRRRVCHAQRLQHESQEAPFGAARMLRQGTSRSKLTRTVLAGALDFWGASLACVHVHFETRTHMCVMSLHVDVATFPVIRCAPGRVSAQPYSMCGCGHMALFTRHIRRVCVSLLLSFCYHIMYSDMQHP